MLYPVYTQAPIALSILVRHSGKRVATTCQPRAMLRHTGDHAMPATAPKPSERKLRIAVAIAGPRKHRDAAGGLPLLAAIVFALSLGRR
jgi:hypothetical protein